MKKVKISKKTESSLLYVLEKGSKQDLLIYHSSNFTQELVLKEGITWTNLNCLGLNELTPEQLAIALYVGYEVEETPEEKVLKKYIEKSLLIATDSKNKWEHDAYTNGIRFTLETLNIKIKGIND